MRVKKILVAIVLCTSILFEQNMPVNGSAEVMEGNDSYLVWTETAKASQNLENTFSDAITSELPLGEGEYLYTMQMTRKEAESLDDKRKVNVEPDTMLSASEKKSDKDFSDAVKKLHTKNWAKKAINCEKVREGKEKIRIAVLDSGVDIESDVDIAERIDFVEDYYKNTDGSGHGTIITHIAAKHSTDFGKEGILQTDSNIQIISLRILDKNNKAPLSRVIEALQWCSDNEIDIINMSFGTNANSEMLYNMIKKLAKQDILMVAAAGNQGQDHDKGVQYPAKYPEVIGVGSVNEHMRRSSFSSYGDGVTIVAPGENVPIDSYMGMVGVGSGTSYATPYVTAVAALLWSIDHNKTAEYIRKAIEQGAKPLGNKKEYGNGILDYRKSYDLLVTNQVDNNYVHNIVSKKDSNFEIPKEVQGSWSYTLHQKLIRPIVIDGEQMLTDDDAVAILSMSYFADQNGETKSFDVLHARKKTNYVSATKCLYELALKWGKSITTQDQIGEYLKNNYVTSGSKNKDVNALKRAATIATTKVVSGANIKSNLCTTVDAKKMTTSQIWHGKRQLLGFAIHIAGDTYAHKSMCVKDKFKAISQKKSQKTKRLLHI